MDIKDVENYEDLSFAQWVFLGHNIGGLQNVIDLITGKKIIREGSIVPSILFDKNGRRQISEGLLKDKVCKADRDFQLHQPKLEERGNFYYNFYSRRLMRLSCFLGHVDVVNGDYFKEEIEKLLAVIRSNPLIANIANGVYLPVVLPKLLYGDIGNEMERYLAGVEKSYAKAFTPERVFLNHPKGRLIGEVSIAEGSRHDWLIERMKQGPVIGLHFPNPLQGFSVNASREQMSTLPEGFILSGLDTLIAMIMYPDVLFRDWDTPGLDLAALHWRSASQSFYSMVCGKLLEFDFSDDPVGAYDFCSSGLLFIG